MGSEMCIRDRTITLEDLRKSISQAFKLQADQYSMFYVDEDGDEITLSDEHDFAVLTSTHEKMAKIKITEVVSKVKKNSLISIPSEQEEKESMVKEEKRK